MSSIKKVAILGASGNFGTPITSALQKQGFEVTVITRTQSSSTFPDGLPVIRTEYTAEHLKTALAGQDAAVCVLGPAAISAQVAITEAAEAAGVKRFIVDEFGWGPDFRNFPEFKEIGAQRHVAWDRAKELADANPAFSWTGITIGNPIDWAMKRFPLMGFNAAESIAIIYDSGTEEFTGTTLEGIGQAVVGVLQHPDETANRFVKVRSIQTCQNELLDAFQQETGKQWAVQHSSVSSLIESGKRKHQGGLGGWVLELVVAQMFEEGQARCIVASRAESDLDLLGVREETASEVVRKVLKASTL